MTIHYLGLLFVSQGQAEKPEPLYRRAPAIQEKALVLVLDAQAHERRAKRS